MLKLVTVALATILAVLSLVSPADASRRAVESTATVLPACVVGDTVTPLCVWDGRHMGDRSGPSYLIQTGDGVVGYREVSHRQAHCLAYGC